MVESANKLVKSGERIIIASEGEVADIRVDDYARNFMSQVVSRIMFGSNSFVGEDLLHKCKALIDASGSPTILNGLPFCG